MSITRLEIVQNILGEIYDLPPEAIKPEFFDFLEIVSLGAKKYAMDNWLEEDGKRSSEKEMHDSMFHHLAESFVGGATALDSESKKDPLLHLQCRAAMLHTRRFRNITHLRDHIN